MIFVRVGGLCLLFAAMFVVAAVPARAADTIGQVLRAQGQALAMSQGVNRPLVQGGIVASDDTLITLEDSRLEVRLIDGTSLTLGSNATLRIDALVFNLADASASRLSMFVEGALRMVTGKINSLVGASVQVATRPATLMVRGTDFWTGPIDGIFGVLLIEGEVNVRNVGGEVTLLRPGTGTNIENAATAPGPVTVWPQDKVERALAAVAFN